MAYCVNGCWTVSNRIGLGTETPSTALHIVGVHTSGLGIINAVSSDSSILNLDSASADARIRLKYQGNERWFAGMSDTAFNYHIQNGNNGCIGLAVSYATGYVGIGTCSPTAILQVRGPNATGTFFDAQNDGAAGATFVRANNTFPFNEYTFANGNVGIGTTPTSLSNVRLQICDGNGAGTDDMVRLMQCLPGNHAWYRSQRCGGATMIMGATRNSGDGCIPSDSAIIWTTGNNPLVIGTCGRERMRFSTAGNAVLGGTSSNVVGFTGTVLTVNGGGNYQGYEVSTSNVTRMTMVSDGSNGYMSTRVAGMCLIFEAGAASEKMRIGSDGRVGIGTSSASYLLHVNGTFYSAGSSVDYKQGICNYNTDSCLFMCLKPVTYQYKDEYTHLGKELKSETQIGLIAEDVADVYPELAILVNEDEQKVVRNVDYEKLSIILLSEVQKLRKEVDNLKNNK